MEDSAVNGVETLDTVAVSLLILRTASAERKDPLKYAR